MSLSVVQGGPWTRVLEARLEDAPMQQQTFSFAPDSLTEIPAARFLRFEVVSCHGGCGGLSYVTVRNSRGRRSRRAAPWPAPVSHSPVTAAYQPAAVDRPETRKLTSWSYPDVKWQRRTDGKWRARKT